MKKKNLQYFILGFLVFGLCIVIGYGSTYLFDYFRGHSGRELITVLFTVYLELGLMALVIHLFVKSADKSINEQNY